MLMVMLLVMAVPQAQAAYSVRKIWARFSATAGETLATGNVVCIKDADGYAYQADANDSNLRPALGVIGKGGSSGEKVEVIVIGKFTGWTSLSEGGAAYLSETAAAVTQSAPTWNQQIGVAISTTDYFFNFSSYLDSSSVTSIGTLSGATPLTFEGATADDYETSVAVTDPTADRTVTLPDASGVPVLSSAVPEGANAISGTSNGIVAEGATADAYETTVTFTDPTADRTVTIPDGGGTTMLSSLATNAPDVANSVTGSSNGLNFEGATADAHETKITATDPTADRTVTLPDADVNLGAIANSLFAAPYSYFTIALHHEGQETTTLDPAATFQMPFAATLVEVSVCARDIDTTDADETYTVDLEEAGTTVLGSAITISADNTPVVGSVSDSAIADNAKMEVVVTLGGTTPAIDDLTVLLTFKVAHTN